MAGPFEGGTLAQAIIAVVISPRQRSGARRLQVSEVHSPILFQIVSLLLAHKSVQSQV